MWGRDLRGAPQATKKLDFERFYISELIGKTTTFLLVKISLALKLLMGKSGHSRDFWGGWFLLNSFTSNNHLNQIGSNPTHFPQVREINAIHVFNHPKLFGL